ncbi:MAG: thiamine-phosphate pyrophosphorylase [Candidatus Omnitrophica bacterium]|nr:thiamine-phosphate pyrophosphorylase [Candidatus Omnitrophota bacterium]MDD5429716.1 thiamine-phosphate pyrophosphorylase [Candidatus Omnitrophota bacterium]
MPNNKVLRVLDANFNRCKEGLRVIEDYFRFFLEDDNLRKKTRKIRHSLDTISLTLVKAEAITNRDTANDLGKKIDSLELGRNNISQVLWANFQRVKESLRVLEEFSKVAMPKETPLIKKIRYEIYALEKKSFKRGASLRNS